MKMTREANLDTHLGNALGILLPVLHQVFVHHTVLPSEVADNAVVHHHHYVHAKSMRLLGFSLDEIHGLRLYPSCRNADVFAEVVVLITTCVHSYKTRTTVQLDDIRKRTAVLCQCFAVTIILINTGEALRRDRGGALRDVAFVYLSMRIVDIMIAGNDKHSDALSLKTAEIPVDQKTM